MARQNNLTTIGAAAVGLTSQREMKTTLKAFKCIYDATAYNFERFKKYFVWQLICQKCGKRHNCTLPCTEIKATPSFRQAVKDLFFWFHQNTQSSKIWLCLCGGCGTGKTTILKAMFNFIRYYQLYENGKYRGQFPFSCRYLDAKDLADIIAHDKQEWDAIKKYQVLFIDDVGTEPAVIMDYGNPIEPFVELIMNRYNQDLGLVFTTNLTSAMYEQRYGLRIRDRMRECCEIVTCCGESVRHQ